MSDERVLQTLRHMAWERAKGELQSIFHSYYCEWTSDNQQIDNGYKGASKLIEEFIKEFEGEFL
jgi:hypothetical protein